MRPDGAGGRRGGRGRTCRPDARRTSCAPRSGASVVVLEREAASGGIPRHSDHTGYGMRDLRRVMSGPAYARRLTERAVGAGADVRVQSMVTGWADDSSLWVTSPAGRYRLDARAVVLATGARERPRSARLVPGDRPTGVFTTGHLQNHVHEHGHELGGLGGTAVVVGAELVSWSAVLTLRDAGCRPVLMTTEHRSTGVVRGASPCPDASRSPSRWRRRQG